MRDRVQVDLVRRALSTLLGVADFRQRVHEELGSDRAARLIAADRERRQLDPEVMDHVMGTVIEGIRERGDVVVSLHWYSDSMVGSGFATLRELGGVYVLVADDDWPESGPFASLDEALDRSGAFSTCLCAAELTSDVLSDEELSAIACRIYCRDGPELRVNGDLFVPD